MARRIGGAGGGSDAGAGKAGAVVVAETESASGPVSGEVLDAMADIASWLPR